jgi:hypothetical protein
MNPLSKWWQDRKRIRSQTPPREWVGGCEQRWVHADELIDDKGWMPAIDFDPVNPHLSRDLRDSYRLISQTGDPMVRAARDGDRYFLWRSDVERWEAYQRNISLGQIETGTLWR